MRLKPYMLSALLGIGFVVIPTITVGAIRPPSVRPPVESDPPDFPAPPKPKPPATPPAPPPPPPPAEATFPMPIPPPHHHTPTSIAEQAMRQAFMKYAADLEQASENYSQSWNSTDQVSWELAEDVLYLNQLQADLEWWQSADLYSKAIGFAAWGAMTQKVGMELSTQSPAAQMKIAGLVALLSGMSLEALSKGIGQRIDSYKDLIQRLDDDIDQRTKYILWQQDYGGMGQPKPFELEDLFIGCTIETTCLPAWVCTQNAGRPKDCEEQRICSERVVKC